MRTSAISAGQNRKSSPENLNGGAISYLGIAVSLWPMIVPGHFTLREAAASPSTQAFLLVRTLFLLPVIMVYTASSYWVVRGKVRGDIGYH